MPMLKLEMTLLTIRSRILKKQYVIEAFFTAGSDTMPHAFRITDEGAVANDEADFAAGPMTL
ncbi:hypothetical protein ACHAWU_006456 [Discostella pseudostelligera]|uniref:Uncharacterized protein n=1 Tax=Discostella pseudostelligera TaxID=259834 RepID=A0ABD3N4M6_9STRA